jgi:hypothetical protein
MKELPNGNILVTNFSTPSGLYELSSTGDLINYYNVVPNLRGVYPLENGNFLVSNANGVYEINRQNELVATRASGQSRYINLITPTVAGDFFNLQLEANPENAGTVSGKGFFPEGYLVSLDATPDFFHEFVNWTLDGVEVSNIASFQYPMPGQDVVLTANFEAKDLFSANFMIIEDSDDENTH